MSASGSGFFVAFEGVEGSGKSTQVASLVRWLEARGHDVVAVREPGGTELGERMRNLLLDQHGPAIAPWAELCAYMAARAQLVAQVIAPALAAGRLVVADRFGEASVAYQGGGRGLGTQQVGELYRWVTGGLLPSRVYLLDLDPEHGLARAAQRTAGRLDRLESEPLSFHRRVRESYLRQAEDEPRRFLVLDAERSSEDLAQAIRLDLESLFTGGTSGIAGS
ncbi:MAG: dTMP kinase [Candidatus Eisenbacteria bacterium]|uniref:Thymidylate kinase n=1 Tax=Eiseniibacteriota bacterium TaxID=2212470 RepID=A0A956LYU8_UNCEI|nr:dTMP kinase [Candidatus Eisenbacteria bacterium]